MSNQVSFIQEFKDLLPSFAPNFLEDHARRIITDSRIALVELVANCWDAGADRVEIIWPQVGMPAPISIKDNGTGMTLDEFKARWYQLNYNRTKSQGEDVIFPPDNMSSHRKAFGRNGKGRHSMFCFSNNYTIETWCNGQINKFTVSRTDYNPIKPYTIEHLQQSLQDGHGTIVSTELARNYLEIDVVRDLIGSKFITDPTFTVYLNGDLVEFTSLEHLLDVHEVLVPEIGLVKISQVDTQKTSRTSHPHGIAWWVHKRLVGELSWKYFSEENFVDRRTVEAKRYTFVVEADVLANDVEEDWSGFRDTARFREVQTVVEKHIRLRLNELMKDVHRIRKMAVLEENANNLATLAPESRYYIGKTLDGIQNELPSIKENILSATVRVLANLEKARSGYELLDQLAKLKPDELDKLNEILESWSIQEIRVVMNELDRRLKLIERLEQLVENPSSDELHEIQPLFEMGLWIFGPEYESIQFTSNRTLLTVIKNLLESKGEKTIDSPKRRPDFVVLPTSTIGLYSSDSFDQRSEVNGYEKVLIVELKKGGKKITIQERRQGEDYARSLRNSGKLQESTEINVFVLGTEVSEDLKDDLKEGNTIVYSRAYSVFLRQAHARTFHLHQKIKEATKEQVLDKDVESAISSLQTELLS